MNVYDTTLQPLFLYTQYSVVLGNGSLLLYPTYTHISFKETVVLTHGIVQNIFIWITSFTTCLPWFSELISSSHNCDDMHFYIYHHYVAVWGIKKYAQYEIWSVVNG